MTPQEIDKMEAGREMDVLVAEKVMGIVWDDSKCRFCGWPIVPDGELGCWRTNCSMRPIPESHADEPALYSISISAAWEVVEKLGLFQSKLDSTKFDIGLCLRQEGNLWIVFYRHGIAVSVAPTAPLAICRAALKAILHD